MKSVIKEDNNSNVKCTTLQGYREESAAPGRSRTTNTTGVSQRNRLQPERAATTEYVSAPLDKCERQL